MALASGTQGGVLGLAERVPQGGVGGPVVDGILQALVSGETTGDDAGLPRASSDRCDTTETSECLVVARAQGSVGLGEESREDDPADARKGCEDSSGGWTLDVAVVGSLELRGHGCGQAIHRCVGGGELLGDQAYLVDEDLDVRDGRFSRAGSDVNGRFTQAVLGLVCVDGSNPVAREEVLDGAQAQATRPRGRASDGPQFDDPQLGQSLSTLSNCGK